MRGCAVPATGECLRALNAGFQRQLRNQEGKLILNAQNARVLARAVTEPSRLGKEVRSENY